MRLRLLFAALLVSTGCIYKYPDDVCRDLADTLSDTGARCGLDPEAVRTGFLASLGGSCNNVTSVRDFDAMYESCLPFLESVSCDAFTDPVFVLPDDCKGQLRGP